MSARNIKHFFWTPPLSGRTFKGNLFLSSQFYGCALLNSKCHLLVVFALDEERLEEVDREVEDDQQHQGVPALQLPLVLDAHRAPSRKIWSLKIFLIGEGIKKKKNKL